MFKRLSVIFLSFIFLLNSGILALATEEGRMAGISQYNPPYDVITDDRLAESKPEVFDADNFPKTELCYEDFNDEDFGSLIKHGFSSENIVFDNQNGYSGGSLKITGEEGKEIYPSFRWQDSEGKLKAGDYLVLSARMRAENVSGDGNFCAKLAIYDENGWLSESWGQNQRENIDWTEISWILAIPENADKEITQNYSIGLGAYVNNISGTFYFDDFKLSKIQFEPMSTVLMEPVYKGIIKGEGKQADIRLRAYIDDGNGFYDLSKFSFTSQITDNNHNVLVKTECENVKEVLDVCFSSDKLPMGGDFYLESILTYKTTGNIVQKSEWTLHKRAGDFETKIGIDDYGRVTKEGVPYFPISVINSEKYDDAVNDFTKSGVIDVYMHHGMGWYYNWAENESYRNAVNKLSENYMDIVLSFGTLVMETETDMLKNRIENQDDLRALTTKIVNNFKDLPNLFSYYTFDEMDAMRYGQETEWARKIIESLDLDHPTTCAIDALAPHRPGIYAKTSDFLGYDPYPVTGKEGQDISAVYKIIKEAKELNPQRPVYAILQGFCYSERGDLRPPNKEEFKNMAFQAIMAGACMIDMYSYRNLQNTENWEETWAYYKEVFADIKALEPVILSNSLSPYIEVKNAGEWLNTKTYCHDGKSYLFAVNNQNETKTATLYLDGADEIKGKYSGKTYLKDGNGNFTITLDGYEVEVFEYMAADFKSSEAELLHFSLADSVTLNMESVPQIIIPQYKKEIAYSSKISDNAKLFINGKEAEPKGVINIEELDEILIRIVSENGEKQTEKSFFLKRNDNLTKDVKVISEINTENLEKESVISVSLSKYEKDTCNLILAFYKGNNLEGVSIQKDVEFYADTLKTVNFTLDGNFSDSDRVKLFVWDSLEKMKPKDMDEYTRDIKRREQ